MDKQRGKLWRKIPRTEVTRVRDNSEPSILDLILTNEENMIDEIIYSSPLGSSDYCGLEFVFKCHYELKENKSERWNYFKGDYDNMTEKAQVNNWKYS